jgi:signal transduction histidine kinase
LADDEFSLKKFLFSKMSRKLTFFFLVIGIIAPTIGIIYFYLISYSILPVDPETFTEQNALLSSTAVAIIILIALNTGIAGYFISKSITKPIRELHKATSELEKGNFNVRTNITTNDEIGELSRAFNKSAIALGIMDEEHKQLEKTKSEFFSMTSHELRTPITPLKVQLQMLYKQYYGKLTLKQRETLMNILKNTERLNKIIEDFLEISRIESARLKFIFKKTDVRETVYETINLMEGFAKEKNIQFTTDFGKLPTINADPDRISQVLKNIIHNAIKFSPNNGKIEISAQSKKDFIQFSIKDYGKGMTPKDQIRVFEPFYQVNIASKEFGGTGLGLAICRGIIEAQKGKIWIQSIEGQGSTFYFTIPLKPIEKIQPIKVLFSPKFEIEKELKEKFISILGPMGIAEFDELQINNEIEKDKIIEYIENLTKERILDEQSSKEFKFEIVKIFGDKPNDRVEEINEDENKDINGDLEI